MDGVEVKRQQDMQDRAKPGRRWQSGRKSRGNKIRYDTCGHSLQLPFAFYSFDDQLAPFYFSILF